tara:strand:+ start:95535 stop:95849 length:315 start_codon:yes stop_codon:yes gene_type:complete
MKTIVKLCFVITLVATLTACYHPDIQQGNILTDKQIKSLKIGMTKTDVISSFGDPVLNNIFDPDELTYAYTNEPNSGKDTRRTINLYFKNDSLVKIDDTGLITQ